jgi:hypothetical protein
MRIQVNSDNTILMDARLKSYAKGEVTRVLSRFTARLTRVEVHLSDVDGPRTGRSDKRCLIEVRPASAKPLTTSAKANTVALAIGEALGKMRRSLTRFFGRKVRTSEVAAPALPLRKTVARKPAASKKKAAAKKTVAKTYTSLNPRGLRKKKGVHQARRTVASASARY